MSNPTPQNGSWAAQTVGMSYEILDRMERAVAKVRERLLRATTALNQAGIAATCGPRSGPMMVARPFKAGQQAFGGSASRSDA
ncbi:MAG TPA: hypothetical protein VGZ47_22840 [Gemmataceae bacterium]|nr:hypothetical protein [Gemmataceae bacterium]